MEQELNAGVLVEQTAQNEARLLRHAFFWLGAASDVSFQSIVMSVAWLTEELGDGCLFRVGRAQFCGSASALLFPLIWAVYKPSAVSRPSMAALTFYVWVLTAYMIAVNVALACVAFFGLRLRFVMVGMLLNGLATGGLQSLVALQAGLANRLGGHMDAATAQVSGHGFGIALPTVMHLLSMSVLTPATAAAVSSTVTAAVLVAGVWAQKRLRAAPCFQRLARGGADDMAQREGASVSVESNFTFWTLSRLRQVRGASLCLFINMAVLVYCGLLTPRLPVGTNSWLSPANLSTVLLGVTNCFDFLGRVVMGRYSTLFEGRLFSSVSALLILRCGLAFGLLAYCWGLGGIGNGSSVVFIGTYVSASFLGGLVAAGTTYHAQAICMKTSGPNMDTCTTIPCPLAAQMMWLAIALGSFCGSLLPSNILS